MESIYIYILFHFIQNLQIFVVVHFGQFYFFCRWGRIPTEGEEDNKEGEDENMEENKDNEEEKYKKWRKKRYD